MSYVLITAAGGGVGQSIIKCLEGSRYVLLATDAEPLSAGLYTVHKAFKIPYASDPSYIEALLTICEKEKCQLLFPGSDIELYKISIHKDEFRQHGVTAVVSDPKVVEMCDDKYATYCFLIQNGFKAPNTIRLGSRDISEMKLPLVLKPMRGGSRSEGVFIVHTKTELDYRLLTIGKDNYVAQEYLEGDEYTCGTVSFDGKCHGCIVMRRILRDGDTYKAFVVNEPMISDHVTAAAEKIKLFGPCNFQLKLKDGNPYIFEINPRCSGTTYSRALAGFNEPLITADYLMTGKTPSFLIRKITILRYWKELAVENEKISNLSEKGYTEGGIGKL